MSLRVSSGQKTPSPRKMIAAFLEKSGEPGWNRTTNQQIKSLLLCQLSYGPTKGG